MATSQPSCRRTRSTAAPWLAPAGSRFTTSLPAPARAASRSPGAGGFEEPGRVADRLARAVAIDRVPIMDRKRRALVLDGNSLQAGQLPLDERQPALHLAAAALDHLGSLQEAVSDHVPDRHAAE